MGYFQSAILTASSRRAQLMLEGVPYQIRLVVQAEFSHQIAAMGDRRFVGNAQPQGNLGGGETLGDQ